MAIKSGRSSQINGIGCSTMWSTSIAYDNKVYAASCTGGGTGRTRGNSNETGTIAGLGSPPTTVVPGSNLAFVGIIEDGDSVGGNIRINELTINVPIETNDPVSWSASFGAQGLLTPGTASATAEAVGNSTVKEGAGTAATPTFGSYSLSNARALTLTITAPEKTYVTSQATYRDSGNLEATASVQVYDEDPYRSDLAVSLLEELTLPINASDSWVLRWCRVNAISNFVVNRETQDIVGYTVDFGWSNNDDITTPTQLGSIQRPDDSYLIGSAP